MPKHEDPPVLAWAAASLAAAAVTTLTPSFQGSAYDTERNAATYVEEHRKGFLAGKQVCTRTDFLGPDGKSMPVPRSQARKYRGPTKFSYHENK